MLTYADSPADSFKNVKSNLDTYKNTMDHFAKELSVKLSQQNISLCKDSSDGRANSIHDEEEALKIIRAIVTNNSLFDAVRLLVPSIRHWYDFALTTGEDLFPFNIKSSELKTSDNISSKLGIIWALTGLNPDDKEISAQISWPKWCKLLSNNLSLEKCKDYGFIIINKNDPSDVFPQRIRSIAKLIPNGNNLPFQCNWGLNRDQVHTRGVIGENSYIINTIDCAFDKRIDSASTFKKYVAGPWRVKHG